MTSVTISIAKQQLELFVNGQLSQRYEISTAKNGVGEKMGSGCTPLGKHRIRAKIGAEQPLKTVFIGRRPTGEIYTPALGENFPKRDWILSRILWLGGLEAHKNRYGKVDTTWRYIYIHGCPEHLFNGQPESHGCIRMKNKDIIELFTLVDTQTLVNIIKD
ncbi:MAG: L,D-transpeptidase [Methylococcales bacterium]|nr:L,D-transpeptidase [Methylococcales bacterium]